MDQVILNNGVRMPIAGFGVMFRGMFREPITEQYPEEQPPIAARFHGRHQLNRYDDGLEKCIGCELCAGVCPAKCIYVRGKDNDPLSPNSGLGMKVTDLLFCHAVFLMMYLKSMTSSAACCSVLKT